jgi:large subunit ribosomal protein LP1
MTVWKSQYVQAGLCLSFILAKRIPFRLLFCPLLSLVQSDKIISLTTAANVDLEPIWATLLAKALEGKNVKDLLSNVGAGGGAPAVGGGAPAAAAAGGADEAPKEEEKKEEEKEESDDDMVRLNSCLSFGAGNLYFVFVCQGFGLFD